MDFYRAHVLVCGGSDCTSSDSEKVRQELENQINKNNLSKQIKVITTGCFGLCAEGPVVVVYPEGVMYTMVRVGDVEEIVKEHFINGRPVKRLMAGARETEDAIKSLDNVGFFKRQVRIALRNCGIINPEDIDEYIAYDGYKALAKALTESTPEQVIDEIKRSGLRGRRRRFSHRFEMGTDDEVQKRQEYVVAMPTKATTARSWTEAYLRATPQHNRGHDHCGLCHRGRPGIHLRQG